ncbi:hypothetical protein RIF29_11658 [Crotalaria pallida]|uniref:Histone-lysine N-methyltransferase ASHH2 n=1 Tax=Crotalaria pallida TaxID=3830 RepID=A0AAN9IMC3_CROPI
MGSCGNSDIVDDLSGGSVTEQHSCSELPVQSAQQSCSEEAYDGLDTKVEVSGMIDGCMDLAEEGHVESASLVDVTEGSGDALVSECKNVDISIVEKVSEDDCQNQSGTCSGNVEVSGLISSGLCSEGKFQHEVNLDIPLESITVIGLQEHCVQQGEHEDDKSNILPPAGDDSAVVEGRDDGAGLPADAFNCVPGCSQSEISPGSEPMTDLKIEGILDIPLESITVIGLQEPCVHQGDHEDDKSNILLSSGDDSTVVEGREDGSGLHADAFNCISGFRHSEISLGSEPATDLQVDYNQQNEQDSILRNADPMSKIVKKCDDLGGLEADACRPISPSQGKEVPSDSLCTEVGSKSNQHHDKKDGKNWEWNGSFEEMLEAFVDKENNIIDSRVVDSPRELTLLDQGNDMKNGILQVEDSLCKSKDDCPSEETTNRTFGNTIYPESCQPSADLINNSSSKDVPDLLPNGDNVSFNNSNAVDNLGQIGNEGKGMVDVDCIAEGIPLRSQRNNRSTKPGRKTQSKNASRKCKNKASVTYPSGIMKVMLEVAKKKRSCISKPARSSMWGMLGNIEHCFEQDNEIGVSEAMGQGLGKARRKHQSGKAIKNGASSSSLNSGQKSSASTANVRLRVKIGKEIDLSRSSILIPEADDDLTSASHLGSGSGSQKVASNAEGEISEVVALGKLESYKNDLGTDALVLNGQITNSLLESATIIGKSDGDAEEPCHLVPSKLVSEALIEPINNKGMDPGTSPDSEVINTTPEDQVGEGQEDLRHAVLGSSKEFNSNLDVTMTERGKKKDKLICSKDYASEDGSQGPPRNNRAKNSKDRRSKKNLSGAVSSLELPTSTEINASTKSVSSKELATEPLPLSGDNELGDSTEALKVNMEVKTTCNPSVNHEFSESQGLDNLLSPARSLGRKLPKSLLPSKVSKNKSRASDSSSKKKTTYRCKEKQKKSTNKCEVKGKGVSSKVMCEVEDHPHEEANVGNHKLEAIGEVNASDNRVSVNVSNLDMVPGVGLGEQQLSPRNAWVRCDDCLKWRRIPAVLADSINETNSTWTCEDNGDKAFADCAIPQEMSNAEINAELGISDEEDAYENNSKNYKQQLEYRLPSVSQESTFSCIFTNEFLHRSHKTQTIDEIMVCHCKPPPEGTLGCGDECLNRMLNIECVKGTCPCGDLCSNQQFQKRKYASLNWFKCGKKGYGLKALEDITKGQFLIEYVGEVLDMHAYEARQREYALKGHRHFYFMTLNGSEVIDASAKGNLGRFINHSCDPNCRTEKWMVNGEICIGLFASKNIKQGDEVTFDYNYVRVFGAAAKKCYCGSRHCRGYIGGGDPLDAELIVQGDSDEEFPEPVMLTEDGEIKGSMPTSKDFDNVDRQPTLKDRSSEMEDSKDWLPTSARGQESSQKMEDVTGKPVPDVQPGYPMESELADNNAHTRGLDATSLTTISRVLPDSTGSIRESKSEKVEGRHNFPPSNLRVKAPRPNGPIKKGKICANPPNGLKAVTANQSLVSSMKLKKVVEGSSNGRFEAVQEKLNELLDGDGGISKRKDATKRYLKLLLLTVASGGDRSNGEAIQSNRDLSMILDALLKTKSRTVLNDIINKNGLQMLHKIMKQYRRDFKKIPILRKLLKVLEYLAVSNILTFDHINSGPPCHGMESFRESMLSLTEHDDRQVHQIARSFRDRWIPRPVRKHYMDRDDNRVESHRSFHGNRFSAPHNHRHEQEFRSTEAIDRVQQSTPVTTPVDTRSQESSSPLSLNGGENNGTKKRKRKSRWDQPAETNLYHDAVIGSIARVQNIPADVPPGFPCPAVGSFPASVNLGDLALPNAGHPGCSSDSVVVHPKEKFNSAFPVLYGMPWSIVQQYGTPHSEISESWVTAPGMTFNPFPPLPSYRRKEKDSHPSSSTTTNATDAMSIDQPAEVRHCDTSGPVTNSSNEMIPSTTGGANPEDTNLPCEDNDHVSKLSKGGDSYDLGTRYFRQQKWNNSKIHRPWFRRNAWKCDVKLNNSNADICGVGVGDVPKESKGRDEKGGNNI